MKPIPFSNSYVDLGRGFYQAIAPSPVEKPGLIVYNEALGDELGLADTVLHSPEGVSVFAGNEIPEGAAPLAMAYSGHQFGQFNSGLGDGRAILLGQIETPAGQSKDIHLKGSGRTAFSRNGDGRAALGPVLREYLVSEAMARLGVPTTRALAAVETGETVIRDQILPGAIITRVASSFVRIGTFEYFRAKGDQASLLRLADYVIEHHYPHLRESQNPYLALLETVIDGQASLVARWMQLGFIHGVMNTDNMSILCETIDYGPCAFMDHYAHERVFSSIDHYGRYAYNNQPNIALWNLTRFAECLVHLIDQDTAAAVDMAKDRLERFSRIYLDYWLAGMRAKLGLGSQFDQDQDLIEELLDLMAGKNADFTQTFRRLSMLDAEAPVDPELLDMFGHAEAFSHWVGKWRERLRQEASDDQTRRARMFEHNPVFIPRNHLIEAAIRAAEDHGDFSVFHDLRQVLQRPYEYQAGKEAYMQPPQPHEVVENTFCGT